MPKRIVTFWIGLWITTLVACQSDDQPGDGKVDLSDDPKTRAATAKDALFEELSGRLTRTMLGQGPVAAIEVCSQEAPEIARQVAQSHHVKIGRTSMKLRNPKNQPPEWAKSELEALPKEPRFVDLPDGGLGAIYPIILEQRCLMCHGAVEQMGPEIKEKLAALYPDDQATGFHEGDLRGWFWVEVPSGVEQEN